MTQIIARQSHLRIADLASPLGKAAEGYLHIAKRRLVEVVALSPEKEWSLFSHPRISIKLVEGVLPEDIMNGKNKELPSSFFEHVHLYMCNGKFSFSQITLLFEGVKQLLIPAGLFLFCADGAFFSESLKKAIPNRPYTEAFSALNTMLYEKFRVVYSFMNKQAADSPAFIEARKIADSFGFSLERLSPEFFFSKFSEYALTQGAYFAITQKK